MAAETPTHRDQPGEQLATSGYLSPTLDFVAILIGTMAIALLGVVVMIP